MICQECGMPCEAAEYHPYAACLLFKACHDSAVVRANLKAIRADALEEAIRVTAQAKTTSHACDEIRALATDDAARTGDSDRE